MTRIAVVVLLVFFAVIGCGVPMPAPAPPEPEPRDCPPLPELRAGATLAERLIHTLTIVRMFARCAGDGT